MTDNEKRLLILRGISARPDDYKRVKSMLDLPLRTIQTETDFSIHFITTCRKIAGWTRRKNQE